MPKHGVELEPMLFRSEGRVTSADRPLGFNDTVSINMISILQMKDSKQRDARKLFQVTQPLRGDSGLEGFNIHVGKVENLVELPMHAVQDFLLRQGVGSLSSGKGQTVDVLGFADHAVPTSST